MTVWEGGKDASTEDPTGAAGSGGLFGDPETRAFYEELPDLLATVPLTILGLTPEQVRHVFTHLSLCDGTYTVLVHDINTVLFMLEGKVTIFLSVILCIYRRQQLYANNGLLRLSSRRRSPTVPL